MIGGGFILVLTLIGAGGRAVTVVQDPYPTIAACEAAAKAFEKVAVDGRGLCIPAPHPGR